MEFKKYPLEHDVQAVDEADVHALQPVAHYAHEAAVDPVYAIK